MQLNCILPSIFFLQFLIAFIHIILYDSFEQNNVYHLRDIEILTIVNILHKTETAVHIYIMIHNFMYI